MPPSTGPTILPAPPHRGKLTPRAKLPHSRWMRAATLACLVFLAAPASAQRFPFDTAPPPRSGKVPYDGPQNTGKPPPAGSPDRSGEPPRVDRGSDIRSIPRGRPASSGTGFVVAPGRIMTNNHVITECARTVARNTQGASVAVRVLATDRQRDLAVLGVATDLGPALTFRGAAPVRRGETGITYGFPLSGLLSLDSSVTPEPSLTPGVISRLSGLQDNPRNYTITAPVNPGQSGGPLLDSQGHVIGVVVSKLNAIRVAQMADGDIPQNVNFAVKSSEALAFLRANGVEPRTAATGVEMGIADIGDIANPSTVYLQCFR